MIAHRAGGCCARRCASGAACWLRPQRGFAASRLALRADAARALRPRPRPRLALARAAAQVGMALVRKQEGVAGGSAVAGAGEAGAAGGEGGAGEEPTEAAKAAAASNADMNPYAARVCDLGARRPLARARGQAAVRRTRTSCGCLCDLCH